MQSIRMNDHFVDTNFCPKETGLPNYYVMCQIVKLPIAVEGLAVMLCIQE